jgi:glycopeptide antibiotics resistance protein
MLGETEIKVYALGAIERIPEYMYIGIVVFLGVGSLFSFLRKGLCDGFRYTMLLLLLVCVLLILGTSVVFRNSVAESHISLIPLSSYFDYGKNTYLMEKSAINILNVVMFIPVGLLLGFGLKYISYKKILFAGIGLSVAIELLQFILKRGLCETDDVIHNTVGCIIGFAIYKTIIRLIKNVQTLL